MHSARYDLEFGEQTLPCALFEVENARGIVLMGHGLGVTCFDSTVVRPAHELNKHGFTVLAPELPLHGERGESGADWHKIVSSWQTFWAGEGRRQLLDEWSQILAYAEKKYELPIYYFGLSLGTQYGLLFLAQTTRVTAGVLGLFGSEPLPKSQVMNYAAPRVSIPVYFVQKIDDEIHPQQTTTHLFESLGSEHKVLDSSRGKHADVSLESIQNAVAFLVSHARD